MRYKHYNQLWLETLTVSTQGTPTRKVPDKCKARNTAQNSKGPSAMTFKTSAESTEKTGHWRVESQCALCYVSGRVCGSGAPRAWVNTFSHAVMLRRGSGSQDTRPWTRWQVTRKWSSCEHSVSKTHTYTDTNSRIIPLLLQITYRYIYAVLWTETYPSLSTASYVMYIKR